MAVLRHSSADPGGRMPPSTAGRMPAATWWRCPDAPSQAARARPMPLLTELGYGAARVCYRHDAPNGAAGWRNSLTWFEVALVVRCGRSRARSVWSARSLLPLSARSRLAIAPASWTHSKRFAIPHCPSSLTPAYFGRHTLRHCSERRRIKDPAVVACDSSEPGCDIWTCGDAFDFTSILRPGQ